MDILKKYHVLVELMRPVNGLMAGIAALIGYLIAEGNLAMAPELFMAISVPFLISCGGMLINDYFDRDIDKHRPIQRGEIKPNNVALIGVLFYISGITLAFAFNIEAGYIALIAAAMLTMYDASLAKTPLVGNIIIALNTALTFPFGAAFTGNAFPPAISTLFIMALFSTLARETYKGIQDMEKDRKTRKTLAIILGAKKSCALAALFNLAAISISPVPALLNIFGLPYLALVALADLGFVYTSVTAFNSKDFYIQSRNMKILQALGLLAFLAGALNF
ncbi:MAG: UbiA family prenyltransferase [Candidatus Diapherotrites archaeon]|nr:UbiA family prenyltransferase [Candidatus Diapherotrites archaeon]